MVKAIVNAISKIKPKPIKPILKNATEAIDLIKDSQGIIDDINAGNRKPLSPTDVGYVEPPVAIEEPLAPSIIQKGTNLLKSLNEKFPQKAKLNKINATEYLEEDDILRQTRDVDPKIVDGLNINTLNNSDDVFRSAQIIAKQLDPKEVVKQTRGVQTWTAKGKLAAILGVDEAKLTNGFLKMKPGTALNDYQIEALTRLLIAKHKKVEQLGLVLRSENGDTSANALAFMQEHAVVTELQKMFIGARAEAGRALQSYRQIYDTGVVPNLNLDRLNREAILLKAGGKDQILNIAEAYLRTPGIKNKVKFLEKSWLVKGNNAMIEIFLNNILFGTMTHVKNISGSWIFKTMQRSERRYAVKKWGGKVTDGVAEFENEVVAFAEHMATTAMWRTLKDDFKQLNLISKDTLKSPFKKAKKVYKEFPGFKSQIAGTKAEHDINAFSGEAFGMDDGPMKTFVDVIGRIVTGDRMPYRWLQNGDDYFKNGAYISEIYALAYRETIAAIKAGTLTMEKAPEFLATLVVSPPKEFTEQAFKLAQERTFQTPLKKRGDAIGDTANFISELKNTRFLSGVSILSSQYFPFLRTPANIAGTATERNPLLSKILKKHRDDLKAGGATTQLAKAKHAMGWAFLAAFVPLGYFGKFSGSDPDKRGFEGYQLREASNKQPKSFRLHNFLNDEWGEVVGLDKLAEYLGVQEAEDLQLSFNGFEPAVLIASVAADLGFLLSQLAEDHNDWDDIQDFLLGYALSIGDNVGNSTFMQGTAQLVDVYTSIKMSDNDGPIIFKEFKKMMAGQVPYSTFLNQFNDLGSEKVDSEKWGLVNKDDFNKLNLSFIEMIKKKIPGVENDLPVQTDFLGDEVMKQGMLSGIKVHPLIKEYERLEIVPGMIKKKMMIAVDLGLDQDVQINVVLNSEEYSVLETFAGKLLKQKGEELLKDKTYTEETIRENQRGRIKEIESEARTEANDEFKDSSYAKRIKIKAQELAIKQIRASQGSQDETNRFMEIFENQ
jgi:hypothetical protein